MSWTRAPRAPSRPNAGPGEQRAKGREQRARKGPVIGLLWPPPFMDAIAPPSITVGARRYFWASPTSSEKNKTPTGIVHLLLVTKLFDQMALLRQLYIPNHRAVKIMATSAKRMTIQNLGNLAGFRCWNQFALPAVADRLSLSLCQTWLFSFVCTTPRENIIMVSFLTECA